MVRLEVILSLAILGIIDFKSYKIPNVILCGWLGTMAFDSLMFSITPKITISSIMDALIVAGSYIPLKQIVKCSPGDFKLFAVLTIAIGVIDMLTILFITMLIALFPLASGIKKVPIAFLTFFGYIAFLLMKSEGII